MYDVGNPARLARFVEDMQASVGPLAGAPQPRGGAAADANALVTPMKAATIADRTRRSS